MDDPVQSATTARGEDVIAAMARLKAAGQPFALATVVRTEDLTAAKAGAKALFLSDGAMVGWVGGGCTLAAARKVARRALNDGRARMVRVRPAESDDRDTPTDVELHDSACPSRGTVELFVEPILPHPLLVVAGTSPTARALCALGRAMGFGIAAAPPPGEPAVFPDPDLQIDGLEIATAPGIGTGFVVVATQGKGDRAALRAALDSGAPYVAFVGSRKKAEALKQAMCEAGIPPDRIGVLRAPAGLDIGAATAEEIALSILAEIVRDWRHGGEALPQAQAREAIDGGSFDSEIVSPVRGACERP